MSRDAGASMTMRLGAGFLVIGTVLSGFGAITGIGLLAPQNAAVAAEDSSAVTQKWVDGAVIGGRVVSSSESASASPSESAMASDSASATGSASASTSPSASNATAADPTRADQPVSVTSADYSTFKDLSVTVSQTKKLASQGILVTWTGAKATAEGEFTTDYMQIMQCWGDASTGPTPDQCQFGASTASLNALLGTGVASRSLGSKDSDPAQSYDSSVLMPTTPARPNAKNYAIPFRTVTGERVFYVSDYFANATTNEVDAVRSGGDGSGQSLFQLQTSLDAPHLGCGAETSEGSARSCWLVIVPRGEYNTNGTPASANVDGRVSGSPLSQSAWNNRMVFPLSFLPTSSQCAIGATEVRIVGNEQFTDAMTSWQAAICGKGMTLGYSQLGDDEAKAQLESTSSGTTKLAVVSSPLSTSTTPAAEVAYAPLAQNAIVIAYTIDRSFKVDASDTSDAYKARMKTNGTPVTNLTLNARLVAKLLTQSYRIDVPGGGVKAPLTNNPYTLVRDPEFVALNPEFANFQASAAPEGLIVSLGSGDNTAEVWNWIKSDPVAAAFLDGKADEWGMVINPNYKSLHIASDDSINSFPKADLTVADADKASGIPGFGTLDMRPYSNDYADSAYHAARLDAGTKIVWDSTKSPAQYVSGGSQLPGQHFEIAITTLTSAERYGLNVAKLVNSAGQAVAPTAETITAAVNTMTATTASPVVAVPDFSKRVLDTYPLPTVSYAAVSFCDATTADLAGYSTFLEYAADEGQVSGQDTGELPIGYVPLTTSQRAQVAKVAKLLVSPGEVAAICDPATATSSPSPSPSASSDDGDITGGTSDSAPAGAEVPVASDMPSAAQALGAGDSSLALYAGKTANDTTGIQGAAVAVSMALGIPALLGGFVLLRKGRKLSRIRL